MSPWRSQRHAVKNVAVSALRFLQQTDVEVSEEEEEEEEQSEGGNSWRLFVEVYKSAVLRPAESWDQNSPGPGDLWDTVRHSGSPSSLQEDTMKAGQTRSDAALEFRLTIILIRINLPVSFSLYKWNATQRSLTCFRTLGTVIGQEIRSCLFL